jgi:hypothetical protein
MPYLHPSDPTASLTLILAAFMITATHHHPVRESFIIAQATFQGLSFAKSFWLKA